MTNAIPENLTAAAQAVAAHAGYNISGADIAMALTLTGTISAGITHFVHLSINAWRRAGGLDGVKTFFNTGK